MTAEEKLKKTHEYIASRLDGAPEIAIILGSGLGAFSSRVQDQTYLPYSEIPGFPVSTVSGHEGRFVFGRIGSHQVVVMQGRVHYYEGYAMEDVVLPVRLMKLMGAQTLILTNAAGGVNSEFSPGDLMVITDQITSFVPSPLRGPNFDSLGTRFPDMTEVYDKKLVQLLDNIGYKYNITLRHGTYLQTTGPNYETPAEIRMFAKLGADAVGMSTAVEAMAAHHAGMRVCGVSCITNMASGIADRPLNHLEVKDTANKVAREFETLIENFVRELP